MNKNARIAKELVRIAKMLVAVPTATPGEFDEFNKGYMETFGKNADSSIWDILPDEATKQAFLAKKNQAHPNLTEFLDQPTLKKILDEGYFTICSAGLSSDEYNELKDRYTDLDGTFDKAGFDAEKNALVKSRLGELCSYLDRLNVKYCEVLGQFYDEESGDELAELSYLVDLTDIGRNDDARAKQILRGISNFCGNEMNQTAVIEGIRGQGAYVYCGGRTYRPKDGYGDTGYGRSTVRNSPKSRTDWSDNYDWDADPLNPEWQDKI